MSCQGNYAILLTMTITAEWTITEWTGGYSMANKDTVNKVKSLLEGHCYGPLREAAEKWLNAVDEKYDVKDKADKAWDKLNEVADKYSDASIKFGEKMSDLSENVGEAYDKLSEKASPVVNKISEKASPVVDKASDKLLEIELIKQLKEGVSSVGDMIETFGADDAKEKFGGEFADKMKAHAEALKEKGEAFCDCEACQKARSILKDFGEDFDDVKEKAAGKFEELKAKADEAIGDAADEVKEAAEEAGEAADEIPE